MAYRGGGGTVIDRVGANKWVAPDADPTLVPALPGQRRHPSARQPLRPPPRAPACPEIDCIRHLLPKRLADAAELRSTETGVGADRVLVTSGLIGEETYVAALAERFGVALEPLFGTPRHHCSLADDRLIEAATTGMLPLSGRHGPIFVVAPLLVDSRRLVTLLTSHPDLAPRFRFTSTARLRAFVNHHGGQSIEDRAVHDLRRRRPDLSAGVSLSRRLALAGYAATAVLAASIFSDAVMTTIEVLVGFVFLAWTGLRLLGLLSERLVQRRAYDFADDWLPTYSVVVALYREGAAVNGLVDSLRALNYPGIMAQTPQAFQAARS